MDLHFLAVGRLKGAEQELCERYIERIKGLGRQMGIKACLLTEIAEAKAGRAPRRKAKEAEQLLARIGGSAHVVALDEKGRTRDTRAFARFLTTHLEQGASSLVFVLGGPDGHDKELLERADQTLSLSPLTLPHGLARVMLTEQVYRALTIRAGHPYHRD